jgi:hypothetical protein
MAEEAIDIRVSNRWAIASVSAKGAIGMLASTFDLANIETGRAHRLTVKAGGFTLLTISPESSMSDYVYFTTPRPVNFEDFDGKGATIMSGSALVGSYTVLTVYDGPLGAFPLFTVKIASWGVSLPGVGADNGWTSIEFGDGKPLQTIYTLPAVSIDPPAEDVEVKSQTSAKDS